MLQRAPRAIRAIAYFTREYAKGLFFFYFNTIVIEIILSFFDFFFQKWHQIELIH